MTLYYTLVFMLLMAEMALFMLLIIPLPFTIRRKMFTFISENPLVAKVQYGMKITFIFILILFLDSVNRVYRVQLELAAVAEKSKSTGQAIMGHERQDVQVRKFYSQRNMYLCGFTLFLSLILNRTYTMILEVLRLEEKIKQLEGVEGKQSKESIKLAEAGDPGEIARLKKEIERKDANIAALKEQSKGLHREWDALGEKFSKTQDDGSTKKDR